VHVARGIGAFTSSEQAKASVIRKGKYALWHRLDVQERGKDLAVGTAYFPNSQDIEGHTNANEELRPAAQLHEQRPATATSTKTFSGQNGRPHAIYVCE
jgi:hypothetical protein